MTTGFAVRSGREQEQFLETPAPLSNCPASLREEILRTLLDVLRRSLAVKVDALDPQKQLDLVEHTKPRLLEGTVWYFEDHRYDIRDTLAELVRSESKPAGGAGSRSERMAALRKRCDSKLEGRWLDHLDALALRPPSDAQYLIEACSTKPDFFYREYNAAIYIDGPPHDEADQIRKDEEITGRLLEAGYVIIRFHHKVGWDKIFGRHPDIFGTPNQ